MSLHEMSRKPMLAGIAGAIALAVAILPGSALAEEITPHVVTPQQVTPHVAAGATAPTDDPLPPDPAAEPVTPTGEAIPADSALEPGARTGVDLAAQPSKDRAASGKDGCDPCREAPRPIRTLIRNGGYSVERRAICAGWRFVMQFVWRDYVYESLDPYNRPGELRATWYSRWNPYVLTPDEFATIQAQLTSWNDNCLTWVTP
jgi:hypothetical protein